MINWFGKKKLVTPVVDLHSHLIPGIDDGVRTLEESIDVIMDFKTLGYEKVITTPHIHPNYPNTVNTIQEGLYLVQKELERLKIEFEIEAAAEYYVDQDFLDAIRAGVDILSFGGKHVLVESAFLTRPLLFEECMFELKSKGYEPILAHPERYRFLEGDIDWLIQLKNMGVLMQVTISSFVGFYGKAPKEIAKKLLKNNMIDFLGSDTHNKTNIKHLKEGLELKEVEKLCRSSFLRNTSLR